MITKDEILALGLSLDDHGVLAEALSIGRTKVVSREVGIGTIMAVMAPNGGAFLDALESMSASDSEVKWTLRLIDKGTFDIGMPVTREQLAVFKQAAPTLAPGIDALLNVAIVPDPVTSQEVTKALEGI